MLAGAIVVRVGPSDRMAATPMVEDGKTGAMGLSALPSSRRLSALRLIMLGAAAHEKTGRAKRTRSGDATDPCHHHPVLLHHQSRTAVAGRIYPKVVLLDSRLQAELEALRKEKADRDAQAQKEALLAEVRAIAAEGVRSAALKAGSTQHMPDGSVALGDTKDQLTPPDRMAVFHTLDGYEKVKKTVTWLELEETLASEEESVLKELYRKVCRRGGAPRSKPAMAHKLVQGLKNAIAEFSTA